MMHLFTLPSLLRWTPWERSFAGQRDKWFPVFRVIFGVYLAVHFLQVRETWSRGVYKCDFTLLLAAVRCLFVQIAPYADDLFSVQGMFPDFKALPTAAFPNILNALPLPWQSQAVVVSLAGFAIVLTVASSVAARAAICVALWYAWAALWNRNPFISNPGLPMVGWTLLACALWPSSSGHLAHVPREARKHWPALFWARMTAANVLGLWGLLQIAAHVLGLPGLRGLAAASVASPLPLVFTAYRGHETFSNTFHFDAEDVEGGTYRGIIG